MEQTSRIRLESSGGLLRIASVTLQVRVIKVLRTIRATLRVLSFPQLAGSWFGLVRGLRYPRLVDVVASVLFSCTKRTNISLFCFQDSGNYSCLAKNHFGVDEITHFLTIKRT